MLEGIAVEKWKTLTDGRVAKVKYGRGYFEEASAAKSRLSFE